MQAVSSHAGNVRTTVRGGARQAAENQPPVPFSLSSGQVLAGQLARPHLELTAVSGAVPIARHHARAVLRDCGLNDLIEPVELVVSEIVTNAVRACGGLDRDAAVRLWVDVTRDGVLVMVWDASPGGPRRQSPDPEAQDGRGLLLVDAVSASWGSFALADEPGKVVWALCAS